MCNAHWLSMAIYAYTAGPPKEPAMLIVADENIPLLDEFFHCLLYTSDAADE